MHDRQHRDGPRPAPPAPNAQRPPQPRADAPGARVALLVDLAALHEEARAQGAELSQHKLRNGIANHRPVVRAIGFAAPGAAVPTGFDHEPADAGFPGGVRFAAAALELLTVAGHLVLAPATPAIVQLAQALRRAGHAVELAGLTAVGHGPEPVRKLGRDCLFVP